MPAEPEPGASGASDAGGAVTDDGRTIDGLTRVLAKACRALGDAGHPKDAASLAAQGWTMVRKVHPKQADRLDGTMHYLARLEG
ncbi:MAG: hypothetical protein ABI275_05515 [Terrimesophilobacter sp.]